MSRPTFNPLPDDLSTLERSWATPAEVADRLGMPAGTIRKWCRERIIVAHKRDPRGGNKGDWAIPIATVLLLEHRLGLTVKRSA